MLLLPLLRLHALTMGSAVPPPAKQSKYCCRLPVWVMIPPSVPIASDLFGFFFYCVLVVVDQLWLGGVTVMAMVTRMWSVIVFGRQFSFSAILRSDLKQDAVAIVREGDC